MIGMYKLQAMRKLFGMCKVYRGDVYPEVSIGEMYIHKGIFGKL